MRVLLVEDDTSTAKSIELMLKSEGYIVDTTDLGEDGLDLGKIYDYDIIILDLMLPDMDGYDVLKHLRASKVETPILILSGLTELDNKIKGLGFGADDYLSKPFSVLELQARVRALLRRAGLAGAAAAGEVLEVAPLRIDLSRHEASVRGVAVALTATEFDLLLFLARNPGVVYSRQQLLSEVWSYNHEGYEHTVNSHINRLRAKIERDPAQPALIRTVWGVGYKLCPEAAA